MTVVGGAAEGADTVVVAGAFVGVASPVDVCELDAMEIILRPTGAFAVRSDSVVLAVAAMVAVGLVAPPYEDTDFAAETVVVL
jgi:hypothetical protein